jgi:hypothetical protein
MFANWFFNAGCSPYEERKREVAKMKYLKQKAARLKGTVLKE